MADSRDARFLALAQEFPADCVLTGEEARAHYGDSTAGDRNTIVGALKLRSVEDIQRAVRAAEREGLTIYPISTGHNWGYGCAVPPAPGCVLVDLSGMQRILDFDASLGIVTLEPGVTQQMLHDFLADQRAAFLVPVTGAGPTCSVLGNALERGYGITPITDHCQSVLSLEAVLADGSLYRSPLLALGNENTARGYKWGIGPYVDGLFFQSSYGIVTRMTIALARRPECVRAFLAEVRREADLASVVTACQEIMARLAGTVGGINIMNARRVLAMSIPYPADRLNGASVLSSETVAELASGQGVKAWTVFGTVYGSRRIVGAAKREIASVFRTVGFRPLFFSPDGARTIADTLGRLPQGMFGGLARKTRTLAAGLELVAGIPNETALPLAYWRSGRQPPEGVPRNPTRDGCGLIWYAPLIPFKPDRVVRYVEFLAGTTSSFGCEPLITMTTLNERVLDSSVPLLFDRQSVDAVERARECYSTLLEEGIKEGFVPYRYGIGAMEWLRSVQVAGTTTGHVPASALNGAKLGTFSTDRYE